MLSIVNSSTPLSRRIPLLCGAAAALTAFCVFIRTLSPGPAAVDSGELAAVCATGGIAHPTGYPLYTLLGLVATNALPGRPVLVLNIASALYGAAALFVFSLLLADIFVKNTADDRHRRVAVPAVTTGCIISGAVLVQAFCSVFWSAALVTEVYSLQALCTVLVLFAAIRAFGRSAPEQFQARRGAAAAFLLGIGFCNHMSTVLLLPALLYLVCTCTPCRSPRRLFAGMSCFAAGLVPYLYLPLRALQAPVLNWGDPSSWTNFFRHVSGRQYRVWMFSSLETAVQNSVYFGRLVPDSFGYVPLLFVPFGMWYLFHLRRRVFWFVLLVFAADVLYAVNYDIKDIDTYFLPALMVCALWIGGGMLWCAAFIRDRIKKYAPAACAALCLIFLFPLAAHFSEVDKSDDRLIESYTENVLKSIGQNGIVLSYQWDYFCSPFLYLQHAEGVRRDIAMIEVQLLRRSWYLTQLDVNHPGIMHRSREARELFSRELEKFENNRPYDPAVIQSRYMGLIASFIRENIDDRPVYLTCEQEPEIGAGLERIPVGMVFRLLPPGKAYVPFDYSRLSLPHPADFRTNDRYHAALRSFYAFMLSARGLYEVGHGRRDAAEKLFLQALGYDAGYALARKGMRILRGTQR